MVVGIIGAGASGMAAALAAAENPNNKILLFERQVRVGRKLQATGNGRCNLTNLHMERGHYHGADAAFSEYALNRYDTADTLRWFGNWGLYTVAEASGRVYPYSDQANSVVDVLRFALEQKQIQLLAGVEVIKARKIGSVFEITAQEGTWHCDKLVIACGGLAGTKLGGSMSGYKLLRSFGHGITKLRPALVQLKSDWRGCVGLKGVRANCHVQVLHDGKIYAQSTGELQFTEYGLSGPVIFEVSRDVCQAPGAWFCKLDFLPEKDAQWLQNALQAKLERGIDRQELLTGILQNRLGKVLIQASGGDIEAVCRSVKGFEVHITEPLGMDSAQVTAGGADTAEFDPKTMESRLIPGLYACGEVLDVDGDCGGYNLQWAWSSGRLAGGSV